MGIWLFRLSVRVGGRSDAYNSWGGSLAVVDDQGYGRGGTPIFTGVFEPLARVTLYLTDENGLGTCFCAA